MLTPINIIINKKIKKEPNFKLFNIQQKCADCEDIIKKELNFGKINVTSLNKDTITVLCKNKAISNEIQLKKKVFLDKINKETNFNIKDIKII